MKPIQIGPHFVGGDNPPYLLAEIGINHQGDIDIAMRMIRAAKEAGAHGVKFQTFRADKLFNPKYAPAEHAKFKALELDYDQFAALHMYASQVGIDFISTPFDLDSLDFLVELGVPAIKIASGDLTYTPLLEAAGASGKPVILSTGMADSIDLSCAKWSLMAKGCGELILLHCVSLYPVSPEHAKLGRIRSMPTYQDCGPEGCITTFPCDCMRGYSDHTIGNHACIAAVALGAVFIEKHFTLDHDLPGDDHKLAANPQELAELATILEETYIMVKNEMWDVTGPELAKRGAMRRNPIDWLRPLERDDGAD